MNQILKRLLRVDMILKETDRETVKSIRRFLEEGGTGLTSVQRGTSVCSVFAWLAISRSLNHQYRFSPFMKGSI